MRKLVFGLIAFLLTGGAIFFACKKDNKEKELANVETLIKSVKSTSEEMRFRLSEDKTVLMRVSYPDPSISTTTLIVDYSIVPAEENDDYVVALLGYFNQEDIISDTIIPEIGDGNGCFSIHPWDYPEVRLYLDWPVLGGGSGGGISLDDIVIWRNECMDYVCSYCTPTVFYVGGTSYYNAYTQCAGNCSPCMGPRIDVHYKEYSYENGNGNGNWISNTYENQSVFIVKAQNFIMNGSEGNFEEIFN
jgi:hypothetical protein